MPKRVGSFSGLAFTLVRLICPPVLLLPIQRRRGRRALEREVGDAATPFDGFGPLGMALVHHATVYGEWGMGQSTVLALRAGCRRVVSVDTAEPWVDLLENLRGNEARFEAVHVDLGPVGRWGRPISYVQRTSIDDYLRAPLDRAPEADLLLIDGRFRVACWATAMISARPGTLIVFDDYVDRTYFHVVEELAHPIAIGGRQAVFVRPEHLDVPAHEALLADFRHVME